MMRFGIILFLGRVSRYLPCAILTGILVFCGVATGAPSAAIEQYRLSPALFIQNAGQWPETSIRFVHEGRHLAVAALESGVSFQVRAYDQSLATLDGGVPEFRTAGIAMSFPGANPVAPEGVQRSGTCFNYVLGAPETARSGVEAFEALVYPALYEGITLHISGPVGRLKYEFHVNAGADHRQIRIRYAGAEALSISADGSLEIQLGTGWAPLRDHAPYIYQEVDGQRIAVEGNYLLLDAVTYGFEVTGQVDTSRPLIIDPEVAWSTYLGGDSEDVANVVNTDKDNNILIAGYTYSRDWIAEDPGPAYNGGWTDGFVTKLGPDGTHLWSTYIGGDSYDFANGVAADANGNLLVSGRTESDAWVSGGYDTELGGFRDAFVLKLDSSGAHLWSTYLGGDDDEYCYNVALNAAGQPFVVGSTKSDDWVSGGFDTERGGTSQDVFVARLSQIGNLIWSTYLGGTSDDIGYALKLDSNDNVVLAGGTDSDGWVSGGYDTTYAGSRDPFVAKLTKNGGFLWSTYLGGGFLDYADDVAVDNMDNILVTGNTWSSGWTSGGYDTSFGGPAGDQPDAFAVKVNSAGEHVWSTYLGATGSENGWGIEADGLGNVFVAGATGSNLWIEGGPFTEHRGGTFDAFVAKLTQDGARVWSTYLGGDQADQARDIALDLDENPLVSGYTQSSDWIAGGMDENYAGGIDGFVLKMTLSGKISIAIEPAALYGLAQATVRPLSGATPVYSGLPPDETVLDVAGGRYEVSFGEVAGWFTPAVQEAFVHEGQVAQVTGAYAPHTGSITAILRPGTVRAAGARWRIDGGPWLESGETVAGVVIGEHRVDFKFVQGWFTPDAAQVVVSKDETATLDVRYEEDAPPSLVLSSVVGASTNAPFVVSAGFSEDVTGFEGGDVVLVNATLSDFAAATPSSYSWTVSPTVEGPVSVSVVEGVCIDAGENPNTASNTLTTSYDVTMPSAEIGTDGGNGAGQDFTTTATTVHLEGTTSPETVAVRVNGGTDGVSFTPGSGVWSYDGGLVFGSNVFHVTAVDAAGNVSTASTLEVMRIPPQDVFVSPEGVDNAARLGSSNRPWKTIGFAIASVGRFATLARPVTIHLLAGTYAERVVLAPHLRIVGADPEDRSVSRIAPPREALVGLDSAAVVAAENTGLRDLTVELPLNALAGTVGLLVDDVALEAVNIAINGRNVTGTVGASILGAGSSETLLTDSLITRLEYGIRAVESHVNITRNHFSDIRLDAVFVRPPDTKQGGGMTTPLLGDIERAGETGINFFEDVGGFFIQNQDPNVTMAQVCYWDGLSDVDAIAEKMDGNVQFTPFLRGSSILAASIFVTVVDATGGARIENARVTLSPASLGTVSNNVNGVYSLTPLIEGLYTITVNAPGFKEAQVSRVEAPAGDAATLTVPLVRENLEQRSTEEVAQLLQDNFATADANSDGSLSQEEVQDFLQSQGVQFSAALYNALGGGDGVILPGELQTIIDTPVTPPPPPPPGCFGKALGASGLKDFVGDFFLFGVLLLALAAKGSYGRRD